MVPSLPANRLNWAPSPPRLIQPRSCFCTLLAACLWLGGCATTPQQPAAPTDTSAAGRDITAPGMPSATPPADPDALPQFSTETDLGSEVALRAIALVGTPYRYGGADLSGFDCSGLVYFVHQELGFTVPRTAAEQQRVTEHLDRSELQPGDLLFFHTSKRQRISHVGIYVGENRFVHAPQSGKQIELRNMDDGYYAPRLVAMGRLRLN